MRLDHRFALDVGHIEVSDAENVHLDARRHERHFRLLVLGNAWGGMQGDGIPDNLNGRLVDALLPQGPLP
jgi:hypothetical protein